MKRIYVEQSYHVESGIFTYKAVKLVNTMQYCAGQQIPATALLDMCERADWTVTITEAE